MTKHFTECELLELLQRKGRREEKGERSTC